MLSTLMPKNLEESFIAVDPVILTIKNGKLLVYLQKRDEKPNLNFLELPGGLLRKNESAQDTLKRKLSVVVSQEVYFSQFHTFTQPKRDPRQRVVSIGYIALIPPHFVQDQTNWYEVAEITKLAFDHFAILTRAITYLRAQLNGIIAKQFLPEKFPLNQLQEVYEIILNEQFDNRNFRRKMIQSKVVIETEELTQGVSHRPAKLFVFA